jgi:hypothetical protein
MAQGQESERGRRADRAAALLIGLLSLIPAYAFIGVVEFLLFKQQCSEFCAEVWALFAIIGAIFLLLALFGFGVAWSIWVRTRLGRIVGLGMCAVGAFLAGQATLTRLGSDIPPTGGDLLPGMALTLAFLLGGALTLVSTLAWIAGLRRG